MNFTWEIIYISPIELAGSSEKFEKRTVVLEEITDNKYKWSISVDLLKDKVRIIEWHREWDIVEISFNLKANKNLTTWKYYNSINWRYIKEVESDVDNDIPF